VNIATEQPPFARRLLDALPFTIWSVDLEGRITAVNNAWARFASDNGAPDIAPESAVIGCSVFSSVADDPSRLQIERAMRMLREGHTQLVRWEFPCSSPEEERVFLMQVTALRTEGVVTGYVFATVDITPAHRSREALINTGIALAEAIALDQVYQEVAAQLRRAIPSTGLVIALVDEENQQFRVVHRVLNDAGRSERSDQDVVHKLSAPWRQAVYAGGPVIVETPEQMDLTVPLVGSDTVLGVMTLRARPIESDQAREEAQRVLTVIAAQTAVAIERARLVRQVEQKRRLETIGEVAAGVAHELRNPLFGISSAAQMLHMRQRDDAVVERNVGRILREVERLNRMVTSLLEFGRPHTTRLMPVDPDAIWDDILESERARLATKQLQVERERVASPMMSLLDAEQFGQVLRNILVNAFDHAPPGSTLRLVSQPAPHGGWRCRLTNGGPAIPPDVLPRVFEFFYSAKTGGTGIGLALCQRIMDEHGGSIAIESHEDTGTTVTLTLPPSPAT